MVPLWIALSFNGLTSVTNVARLLFAQEKKLFCFTKTSINGLSKSSPIGSGWDGTANLLCPAPHDSSKGITASERLSSERGSGPGAHPAGVTLLLSVFHSVLCGFLLGTTWQAWRNGSPWPSWTAREGWTTWNKGRARPYWGHRRKGR